MEQDDKPARATYSEGLDTVVLTEGAQSDALQCCWRAWRVVGPRALAVDMPSDNCTDMEGAIRIAEALLPGVLEVHTFSDGVADTMYSYVGGRWRAFANPATEASDLPVGLGPAPKRADVERLMKRCQIGVGGRDALDEAHNILADCYGMLGRQQLEIERLRQALTTIHEQTLDVHPSEWGMCVSAVEAHARAAVME